MKSREMQAESVEEQDRSVFETAQTAAKPGFVGFCIASLRNRSMLLVDSIFVAYLIVIAALRWQVIASLPEPSGIDPGNWLAFGHSLSGSHSRSSSIVYPPVVPLIVAAFGAVWGSLTGIQVLAVVTSIAPAAGTYVLLRRPLGVRAALLAGFLAPAASTSEPVAWGGYPQLIGLGLLPVLIWTLDRFILTQKRTWIFGASFIFLVTVGTSHLMGAAAGAIALVFTLLRIALLDSQRRPPPRLLFQASLIIALPSLTLVPTYIGLVKGGVLKSESIKGSQVDFAEAIRIYLDNIFKDNVLWWYLLLAIALLSPLILLWRRNHTLAVVAAAILVPTLASLLVLHEVRFAFLLPISGAIGFGACWSILADSRHRLLPNVDKVLIGAMSIAVIFQSVAGMNTFRQQAQWYEVLSPGMVLGLQQLNKMAPNDATLAVSPGPGHAGTEKWPFGWWVEGILDRPTDYASSYEWLNFSDERTRAAVANPMFEPTNGLATAIGLAREHGISYIVIAKGWSGYRDWVSGASLAGARVVIDSESLMVIAVSA